MANINDLELNIIDITTRPQDLADLIVRIFGAPPIGGFSPTVYELLQ